MTTDDASDRPDVADTAELAHDLIAADDPDAGLTQVCLSCCGSIPSCDHAGITVLRDDRLQTQGATDPVVQSLDATQYDCGHGPCVEAARANRIVGSRDLYAEDRWPVFTPAARGLGIASVVAFPLTLGDQCLGALICYSGQVGAFGPEDHEIGRLLAERAAIVLAGTTRLWEAQRTIDQLTEAVESRQMIGQAIGLLMGRYGIGSDESFDRLRRASQQQNRKLREIAQQIVQGADPG